MLVGLSQVIEVLHIPSLQSFGHRLLLSVRLQAALHGLRPTWNLLWTSGLAKVARSQPAALPFKASRA